MKSLPLLTFIACVLILSGCGAKKNASKSNSMSSQYTYLPFLDVNAPSTFKPELLKDLPRTFNIKSDMTSVKDQQERGTCSYFAVAAIAESAIKKKMKIEVNLSEEYLNFTVKNRGYSDDEEGGSPLRNLDVVITKKDGFLLERDWPYQPSWFGKKAPCNKFKPTDSDVPKICYSHNSPSDATIAKKIPADNFEAYYFDADTTNEIIQVMDQYKMPMVITMPINDIGMLDSGDIQYTEEMRTQCLADPDVCGSHVVVLTGYDLDKEVFFFKNSWGKKWGHEGYGTLPISVVDRHVKQKFGMLGLKADLKLPDDYAKDYFNLKKFEIESTEKDDKSIEIKTKLSAEKVGMHTLVSQTILYKKSPGSTTAPDEKNTELVILNGDEEDKLGKSTIDKAILFLGDKETDNLSWEKDADHSYVLSAEKMSIQSIRKLRTNVREQLILKTILFIYTDDAGYKPLQTEFHPLNYIYYDF
ncbi:MAG: C1 family peptidase [Bacteriovorax sp.]|nr:C1 family peptidase [Bacteriovorax sp.]